MIVSIILPIRNEEQFIGKTLQSIIDQKFKGELEIIISDGISNDGTRGIVKEFQNDHKNIILIDNHDQIVPNGFNRALNLAKGKIIVRVDGHSTIAPDFIEQCLRVLKETNADCVGGSTYHDSSTIIGDHIAIAQSSIFGSGGASFRKGIKKGKFVDTLAFGAYKRDSFLDNGGYDEELIRNQDEEFNFRLIQKGGKIWIDPSIKSTYYVRDSILKLFKQYYYYGFFKVRVIQKTKVLISLRHLVPALFVLTIVFTFCISYFYKITWPAIISLGIYFMISIIFSFYESMRKDFKPLILLPFVYFLMHISYGVGFIVGLFYFLNKWGNITLVDSHFDKKKFVENSNV